MRKQIKIIFLIILIILFVIFALLNMEIVGINFGFSTVKVPLVLLLLISILLGVLISFLISTSDNLKQINNYKKMKFDYDQKIENLNHKIKHLNNQLINKNQQTR